jgi:aspartyl-tRNA(Asn)/glutamyl-tRNA(Gln) amidotransferase subunit A
MVGEVEKKVKGYLDKIKKEDGKINSFLYVNPNVVEEAKAVDKKGKKGRLYGQVIGVKSVICVKDLVCSAGSKVLEDWKAPYNATVIERIKAEDGVIIGMLNCDEFACGVSGENSAFGPTQNPVAPGKIPGGSSSGSAAAVSAGFCDVALGSDTGGSIRAPASLCGVVGVRPSYGLVSRYGLMDMCMSLDTIGVLSKNVNDCALVLDVMKGKDEKDTVTFESKNIKLSKPGKLKIGVVRVKGVDSKIENLMDETFGIGSYKDEDSVGFKNWDFKDVDIKHLDLGVETYYLLVYAEVFSTTRKLDGRRFGKKFEDAAGEEVLRRAIGGSEITKEEVSGDYYKKALGVKKLIAAEFDRVFKDVDAIVMPVFPVMPWNVGEINNMDLSKVYAADLLTVPASLAGVCAVSVPVGTIEGVPIGVQVMCNKGDESKMFSIAKEVEGR